VSGISVGHGNSDAPAGPTNGHRRTLQFPINQPLIAGDS
jgi:hypothetical protein